MSEYTYIEDLWVSAKAAAKEGQDWEAWTDTALRTGGHPDDIVDATKLAWKVSYDAIVEFVDSWERS